MISAVPSDPSSSGDSSFDEPLLLLRGVVFGVFTKVAVRARLRDRLDDPRPTVGAQRLQLFAELPGTRDGHWTAVHNSTSA